MPSVRTVLAFLLALVVGGSAGAAWAQTPAELAARRNLLEQAQAARAVGNHAAALDLASRAGRIQMHPSTRRFMAEEQFALGQLADALGTAELCVREADQMPTSANIAAVRAGCTELTTRIRATIGRLVVRVPTPAPPGLQVMVAGSPLNDALWGVETLVTPGEVMVEATAPGFRPFRQQVHVAERGSERVDVTLQREGAGGGSGGDIVGASGSGAIRFAPVFPPSIATPPAVSYTIGGAPVVGNPGVLGGIPAGTHHVRASAPGFRDAEQDVTIAPGQTVDARFVMEPLGGEMAGGGGGGVVRARRNPIGPVLIGLGGAAIAAGVVTLIVSELAYSSLRLSCTIGCDPVDAYHRRDFITAADTAGTVTTIVGGAAVVTGVVLTIVLRPRETPPRATLSFDPQLGTLGVAGRF